jgi:hypothetical protein
MMARSLGKHPIGYDQRTGRKERYDDLVEDGEIKGIRVHRREADQEHPQKRLRKPGPDRMALRNPLPEAFGQPVTIFLGLDVPLDQLWAERSAGIDFAVTIGSAVVTSSQGSTTI